MIPVFIEKDVAPAEYLRAWFKATFGTESTDLLLFSLLRRKHLLVIIDGLSEMSIKTQAGASKLFAELPVGALIITSRRAFEIEGVSSWQLQPQPVSADRIVGFVIALLLQKGEQSFSDPRTQLKLATHITEIFMDAAEGASNGDGNVSLTPLLVRLVVERAIEIGGNRLDELPRTVPNVYFDFLKNLNREVDGRARVSGEAYFAIACKIAKFALGDKFTPGKEFNRDELFAKLEQRDRVETEIVLASLVQNGMLLDRTNGPFTFYSFALDPLSEFLAAFDYYKNYAASGASWSKFVEEVEACGYDASGFRTALELTAKAYDTSGTAGDGSEA